MINDDCGNCGNPSPCYRCDDDADDNGWQPGECDHCYGDTVYGPLGPIYCACAIGQGADMDRCVCGPPEDEQ